MSDKNTLAYTRASTLSSSLQRLADKVIGQQRLNESEGLELFEADLGFVASLANLIRERKHGNITYFNKNFHIEPTNLCVFDCKFCAYSRNFRQQDDSWTLSTEQMLDIVRSYEGKPVTEVHIVGGVHPKLTLDYFCSLMREIKKIRPELHLKAFTAVEYEFMFRKAKLSIKDGLKKLIEAGLGSIPGGGAEIFDEGIREKICADKASTAQWLEIHETAHKLGLHSNATILYGHIETYEHRIDHMERLRQLQDRTNMFYAYIPLKFRNENNQMSNLEEVSVIEDMRNFAVSRIYLDNFPHIKAYWPMLGRKSAQLSLSYGVNDIDGTIDDSTKIYSMAGAEEQHPSMSTSEITELIRAVGREPVERDTLYHVVDDFTNKKDSNGTDLVPTL